MVDLGEDFAAIISEEAAIPTDAEAQLAKLCRHWFEQLAEGVPPSRAELDPMDFPRLLACVMLLDCLRDGDFRIRVAGAHYRDIFTFEPTGQTLTEVLPDTDASATEWADPRTCRDRCRPVFRAGRMHWREPGAALRFQRIAVPIADGQRQRVTQVLEATRIYDSAGRMW